MEPLTRPKSNIATDHFVYIEFGNDVVVSKALPKKKPDFADDTVTKHNDIVCFNFADRQASLARTIIQNTTNRARVRRNEETLAIQIETANGLLERFVDDVRQDRVFEVPKHM